MLGTTEVVVIIAIGLILFGPKKLPEMARSIGRAVGEYQKAVKEFEHEVDTVRKETLDDGKQSGSARTTGVRKKTGPSPQLLKIAKNLGIDTAGKTESQLLAEINSRTKQAEEEIAKKTESTETKPKKKVKTKTTSSP